MKHRLAFLSLSLLALCLAIVPTAMASTTWYVDGVHGNYSNDCKSPRTACKTIRQAQMLAVSDDSIMIAAATYTENLFISKSLTIVGSGAATTIIDGGQGLVIWVYSGNVSLSKVTIRNGDSDQGGGILNNGRLIVIDSVVSGNTSSAAGGGIENINTLTIERCTIIGNSASLGGGGIDNLGNLTVLNSTISGNSTHVQCQTNCNSYGGGIDNLGNLTVLNSTISGNTLSGQGNIESNFSGGGIFTANYFGTVMISNSSISGNSVDATGGAKTRGGGIEIASIGTVIISNSTISENSASSGGGIDNNSFGTPTLQNSIVADSVTGGDCHAEFVSIVSAGYNLSSDSTCNFDGPGDLNNTEPKLGPLQNNGGLTQTQALLLGSPAIDAGNPNGCTDGSGRLLKTDQRGAPRPDKEDYSGCDMGAYERQTD